MLSDIPPPADHSALFSNPAELARKMDRMAEEAFQNGHEVMMNACMRSATRYRKLAARGEQVPEF